MRQYQGKGDNVKKLYAALLVLLVPILAYAALPLSRSTTYVAGTTPVIKAADLNALQDWLAAIYSGTHTVKSGAADGVGGVSLTMQPGTFLAGRYAAETVVPTTTPIEAGQLNRESVPTGMAHLDSACGVYSVFNVGAITAGVPGVCVITFQFKPRNTDPNRTIVHVTEHNAANVRCRPTVLALDGSNNLRVTVACQDPAGATTASAFAISVHSL